MAEDTTPEQNGDAADAATETAPAEAAAPSGPPRLQRMLFEEIHPKVRSEFGVENPMALPRLDKIIINVGIGRELENNRLRAEVRDGVTETLATISGQKPVMIMARKSVANFKVREGAPSAFKVTLRRERMWAFLERLIHFVIPRVKDFRGLPRDAFDARGSYAFGFTEQAVFPEIDMGKASYVHGMNINLVFRNSSPEISRFVLTEMGFPFRREDAQTDRRAG